MLDKRVAQAVIARISQSRTSITGYNHELSGAILVAASLTGCRGACGFKLNAFPPLNCSESCRKRSCIGECGTGIGIHRGTGGLDEPMMTSLDIQARQDPRRQPGARWLRCDLHVHTPFDPEKKFGEDIRTAIEAFKNERPQRLAEIAERFTAACRAAAGEAGLDLVALTDHNSIDGYRYLKPQFDLIAQQARDQGLLMPAILPGVEFSVGGERPMHFLAIFAAESKPEDLDGLIRYVFGERERFDKQKGTPRATGDSVGTFLQKFYKYCHPDTGERKLHFVLLPAHADTHKGVGRETGSNELAVATGIWEEMKGHLRQWAVSRSDWNGFETNHPFEKLPQAFQDLLLRWAAARRGEDWDALTSAQKDRYRQSHNWALVECSDPHRYEAIGSRFTWLKMEVPDVEGVRLALLDPESRLRRMADGPPGHAYPRMERLCIRRTDFFEDVQIDLNSCLNTLIGGRGSGKSTVIEYIRFVLDRVRPEDFPGRGLDDLHAEVNSVLGLKKARDHGETPGTLLPDYALELDVVVAERRYRICRSASANRVVRDPDLSTQEVVPLDVRTLLAPRILSQRQIARIARDPASQRSELDALLDQDKLREFLDGRRALLERITQLQATRIRLKERQKGLPARETELQKINDQLDFLEQSGGKDIVSRFEAYRREQVWLDAAFRELDNIAAELERQGQAAQRSALIVSQLPQKAVSEPWLGSVAERLRAGIQGASEALQLKAEELRRLRTAIEAEQEQQWKPGFLESRGAYEKLRADLSEHGVDFSEHERLLQQRALLEKEISELRSLGREIELLEAQILALRTELVRLQERRAELRSNQARVLEELDADVRLRVSAFRDRDDFASRREEWFAGAGLREGDWDLIVNYVFAESGSVPERINALVASLRTDIAWTQVLGQPLDPSNSALDRLLEADGATKMSGHFLRVLERAERIRLDDLERFLPEDLVEAQVRGADRTFKPIQTGSVGEKSTAILSLLLSAGNQPLVIDQPEDDLDNRYVYDVVVDLLRRRKFFRQIIIATHNANIPVNGDAELIVALGVKDRLGTVMVSGSIDRPEVKGQVTVIMEGSAEAFRLRRERYGY